VIEVDDDDTNFTSGGAGFRAQDDVTISNMDNNAQDENVHHGEREEQVSWPFAIDYCEDLAYRITLTNFRDN
jgi:hypothetical protein